MKIALIGEYSGFHDSLKDGLQELGHDVLTVSNGDGFKNYTRDIDLKSRYSNRFLRIADYLCTARKTAGKIKDYDVVQFISSVIPPYLNLALNRLFIEKILKNNHKSYMVAAGDDSVIWDYWQREVEEPLRYSFIEGAKKHYLSEGTKSYWDKSDVAEWNAIFARKMNGIIPIMYEYYKPYVGFKNVQAIPIPINVNKIDYIENKITNHRLKIFHGLNRYYAKGTPHVEEAFGILKKKYPNDLDLIIAGKLPFDEYMEVIKSTNVIIDQVLSYSLGMNGLQSLAMGKIVLGGNEHENNRLMGYEYNPVFNIKPDPQSIVKAVEEILDRKNELTSIGETSRNFVEKYHNHTLIAEKYLNFWKKD